MTAAVDTMHGWAPYTISREYTPPVDTATATPSPLPAEYADDPGLAHYMVFAAQHQALVGQKGAYSSKEASLDTAASGAVAADSPIIFESIWAGATAAAALATDRPLLAAAMTTAAVASIEVGAAWGSARLIAKEKSGRIMRAAHSLLGKLGIAQGEQTSPATDIATTFVAGIPTMTAAKQVIDPTRTEAQNRSYGIKMGLAATAIGAPVNVAVAEGAQFLTPGRIALATVAVAGLFALRNQTARYLARRSRREATLLREEDEAMQTIGASPNYDLTEEQCGLIEQHLVHMARRQHGRTVSAVWIEAGRPEANLIRTRENQTLPDIKTPALFEPYEDSSMFLAFVDTRRRWGRKKTGRVIRGTRITGRQFDQAATGATATEVARDGGSNMAMIRDLVADGQISGEEIAAHYRGRGVNLANCISVETNFKVGERAPRRWGVVPMSQLGYLAMYNYVRQVDPDGDASAIFAHINQASRDSLTRLGVTLEPFAGRADLRTPAGPASKERYDDKFAPIAMLDTPQTKRAMRKKLLVAPPEIYLTA